MKTFKVFLGGFLVAVALAILFNLLVDQHNQANPNKQSFSWILPKEASPTPSPEPKILMVSPQPEPSHQSSSTLPSDPITTSLYQQSSSDKLETIEKDLDQTDLLNLDQELPEIEQAFTRLSN